MKIKGVSVKETYNFIKEKIPHRFDEFINSLSLEAKHIFTSPIIAGAWYEVKYSQIEIFHKLGEILYDGDSVRAAYELGQYGAYDALKGIYKIFVKVASLDFVIKRTSIIFSTYFLGEGSKIETTENSNNQITVKIEGFDEAEKMVIDNITGWLFVLMSMVLKTSYTVENEIETLDTGKIIGKVYINH